MAFQFHLPDIGEGVIEGEIVSWKVGEGDVVELDQPMVEVMTDKATVEIPAPRAGKISKIHFDEGQICPVGDVLVEIEEAGDAAKAATSAPAAPAHASASSGVVVSSVPSNGQQQVQASASQHKPVFIDATANRTRVLATPAVRRLARQRGIDLATIRGTGKNGIVTKSDLDNGQGQGIVAAPLPQAETMSAPIARPPVSIPKGVDEERQPFRGVRKAIADNMQRSKFTATHFTYVEEVDMTELVEVRNRMKAKAAEKGVKLTYLPFITKAIVNGLKKWPALNSSLDEQTQEIVRKYYYHIGVAAQGPNGLVVTVVKDADQRSIFDLASEISRLAKAVQEGTVKRDELTGSTFTISSLGKIGGVMATPIINFPEVGVVGVHKMSQRPAVVDGKIVPRWLMNLSISLDHRLVDGWDGAMFLQDVKDLLEDPTTMFMEMV